MDYEESIMSKFVEDVQEFHKKFGLPTAINEPHLASEDVMNFRLGFLMEELDEIADGYDRDNLEDVADGIIDLIYVAVGTGLFLGLPLDRLWDEVHQANMHKERAESSEDSKRNSSFDVVKPAGWKAPDIKGILESCHAH